MIDTTESPSLLDDVVEALERRINEHIEPEARRREDIAVRRQQAGQRWTKRPLATSNAGEPWSDPLDPWTDPTVSVLAKYRSVAQVVVGGDLALVPTNMRLTAWKESVAASDLHPTTKLVLSVVALRMKRDGAQGFPTIGPARKRPRGTSIAERADLTEGTVRRHLRIAEERDWIRRIPAQKDDGRWAASLIVPGVPRGRLTPGKGYAKDVKRRRAGETPGVAEAAA